MRKTLAYFASPAWLVCVTSLNAGANIYYAATGEVPTAQALHASVSALLALTLLAQAHR